MVEDIRGYISRNRSEDYTEVLAKDDRWEVFYHLSPMRESLFNWYAFKEGAALLEIGGGFGALTGLFCNRCAQVTTIEASAVRAEAIRIRYANRDNLTVHEGKLEEVKLTARFDYIVLTYDYAEAGSIPLRNLLEQASRLLQADGVLLLAMDNRFGIGRFTGAVASQANLPFASLDGPNDNSFSKQELIDLLQQSGLDRYQFYYPMPDYKLPQLIYSDDYLPRNELRERLLSYHPYPQTLIASEHNLYDELIRHDVFTFFANSFLVECTLDGELGSTIFASMSTDRGRSHSFVTTIHQNDEVLKRPLYDEGKPNLHLIARNLSEIGERGINVIAHQIEADGLRMPYVQEPTLSDYLGEVVDKDQQLFLELIDQLYDCILRSSEHVASAQNVIRIDGIKEEEYGVILSKAYLDMIPFNCFYIDGELQFFDQEFVRDHYPANYVLFRALKYIYFSRPAAEWAVPLQQLQAKYGLTAVLWQQYEQLEAEFVADNRQYEVYKHFYQWTRLDHQQIERNRKLLAGEYTGSQQASERLCAIHQVQLDLLKTFIAVCEKHGLRYFAIHGTLLGAARHQGFIPWDDDIDIAMPREDYNRLHAIAKDVFTAPYELQSNESDSSVFNGGLSKLRNSKSTGMSYEDLERSGNFGMGIDIIALDYIYADTEKRSRQFKRIQFYQRLLLTKTYGLDSAEYGGFSIMQRMRANYFSKLFSRKWLLRQFNKACMVCTEGEAGYMGTFTRYSKLYKDKLLSKSIFASDRTLPFEQLSLRVPAGYSDYLSILFGTNYMQIPPQEYRFSHHKGIFLADIPYRRLTGTFRQAKDKQFVLFGSGQMFEHYMQNEGKQYPPDFIVDNDQAKWGTKKLGIPIRSPKELLDMNPNKLRLIICNIHFRAIGKQLDEMGMPEYYIYIQKKEWL